MNITKRKLSLVISSLLLVSPIASSEPNFYFRVPVSESLTSWNDQDSSPDTDWLNSSDLYDCSWSGFNDEIMAGGQYTQFAECKRDQERTVTFTMQDSYSGETKQEKRQEFRTITAIDTRSISVVASSTEDVSSAYECGDWSVDESIEFSKTQYHRVKTCKVDQVVHNNHVLDKDVLYTVDVSMTSDRDVKETLARANTSCLTLKQQDSSLSDGLYPLKPGGTYQCDMVNGGWTLVLNSTVSTYGVGNFTKSSYSGSTAYWAYFAGNANNVYRDRNGSANAEGIPWTQTKMTVTPAYFSSVDSYSNIHGGAYNRTSIDGMFFDGIYIKTGNNVPIMAMTGVDDTARRSSLGIPDSKSHIGASTKTFTFNYGTQTTTNLLLLGFADQAQSDEAVGYKDWIVWIK